MRCTFAGAISGSCLSLCTHAGIYLLPALNAYLGFMTYSSPLSRQHPFGLGISLSAQVMYSLCLSAERHSLFERVLLPLRNCVCLTAFLLRVTIVLLYSMFPLDPIGVFTFHTNKNRPGWVPSMLRGLGACFPDLELWSSKMSHTFWLECISLISLFHSHGAYKDSLSLTRPAFPLPEYHF